MKTIIYTPEDAIEHEVSVLSALLDAGVDYLYIRKPHLDDFSLVDYMEQFKETYYSKIITTSLIITKEFNLGGYHFTRELLQKNNSYNEKVLEWLHINRKLSSISAHSVEEVIKYAGHFSHLIVSPVFKSISKDNHVYDWDYDALKEVINKPNLSSLDYHSKFFAVGGVNKDRLIDVKSMHFDGFGLMGALWNNPKEALELFLSIQQNIL